ncbi:hypothetical protein U91I_00058 [alpha proteobacterium U9-1i]|nr:hypothetical protein U91I_00058 [alpha proteobacterium U9-1i]
MTDLAEILSRDALRVERTLPASPERVWNNLVDAKKRSRWFCAGDDLVGVGQKFELHFGHHRITDEPPPEKYKRFDGTQPDFVSYGKILEFEPNRRLRFSWMENDDNASDVLFELSPRSDGTRLVITHSKLPNREELVGVGGGWNAHLNVLEDELVGRKHRGFWSDIARFDEEMQRLVPPS